jgi:hypothetical protein
MKRNVHIVAIAAVVGALAAGAVQSLFSAYAVQNELVPPTSGIYTGVQFSQKIGDAFKSLAGCNKGSTAPANVEGATVDGLCWIDDSGSPWIVKQYVNGGWAVVAALNPSDSSYAGVIGGGLGTVASAATTDLNSVPQANVTITGSTTIAGFGSSAPVGVVKIIRFAEALTLTYSSALTVPTGGFDLVTAANDRAIVTHLGSGNWEVTQYTRANGVPVDFSAVSRAVHEFSASAAALYVPGDGRALTRTSYPAYLARVTRAQNGTRTSGNATITSVADTSKFGVGMPVESTGVNAGCTIASIVANTSITLNSSACVTSSGTSTVTVFLTGYGSGGSASTVGVPNCGGAVLAGRETTASRLTSTYFGGNSTAMNVFSGSESLTMAIGNLIAHTHANTLTDPGHAHNFGGGGVTSGVRIVNLEANAGHPINSIQFNNGTDGSVTIVSSSSGVSINNVAAGSASPTPMPNTQPTLIAECNVRVTP